MKIIKFFFSLILIVVVAAVLVLGYFGFIPGLSHLMGADKPKDLGIKYTQADWQAARDKTKIEYVSLPNSTPPDQSIRYEGQKEFTGFFTNEQITALANNRPWIYYPVANVQVKFDPDGLAEASAVIVKTKFFGWMGAVGVPSEAVKYINILMKPLPEQIPVYIKGKAVMEENKITVFDPQAIEVGRLSAPINLVNQYKSPIVSFLDDGIGKINGFYAKKADFSNGQLNFQGTLSGKEISVSK